MSQICEAPPEPDDELGVCLSTGTQEGVGLVYRRHGADVLAVTRRVLHDGGLAEDAAHETFLKAWAAAPTFDASRPVAPWLRTIARRTAIDLQRREARRQGSRSVTDADLTVAAPSPERAWEDGQVRAAVRHLPADEQAVVRLQHFAGLSHREIADRLDVPLGTVKSRSHRAHRRLAGALAHLREDPGGRDGES